MDLLGGDLDAGALGEALGDLGRYLVAHLRQRRGNARRCLSREGGPGTKDHALRGIARGNADALAGLVFFWCRRIRRSNVAGIHAAASDGLFHHGNDVCQRGVAKRLHLQLRNLEVIFHAVLNAHAHQGIQAQVNERQLARQVRDVVAHGFRHDECEAILHGFLRRIPAHGINFCGCCRLAFRHIGHARDRRRAQVQGGGKAFRQKLGLCATDGVDGYGHTTDGLAYHRGDLTARWQVGVLLGGDDARPRLDGLGRGLHDGQRGWRLVRIGGEGHLALWQVDACARQAGNAGRRTRVGPEALAVELGIGRLHARTRAKDRAKIHRHAGDIELAEQVQQRLGGIHLALQRIQQLGIRLAHGEGGGHEAHQRHRVRRDFHQLGVAGVEGRLGGILQVDRVAGHAQPIVLIVDGGTRAINLALIHGGKQRGVQRLGLHAGDGCMQLAQDGVHGRGMPGGLHIERTGELALAVELFHQVQHLLARAAHGGHSGAGVHGGFDVSVERGNILGRELYDGHGSLLGIA